MTISCIENNYCSTSEKIDKKILFFGQRHVQFLLLFFCGALGYGRNTIMSVGIVAIIADHPPYPDIPTYPEWASEKNIILSSFFWGYVIPQIGAGQLAHKLGPKWFLGGAAILSSLFTILVPLFGAHFGYGGVIACRMMIGVGNGFMFPSFHHLLGQWTPFSERARISTFVYAGCQMGIVMAMPITGMMSESRLGWPSVFYLYGGISLIWCLLWFYFGSNSPSEDKRISEDEKRYIESEKMEDDCLKKPDTPWCSIISSIPFWAILIAHCGHNWGYWILLTEIPSYMNYILLFDVKKNSFLSAAPYLTFWLLSFVFSAIADCLIISKTLSVSRCRKLFNTIGLIMPACTLIGISFVDADLKYLAVALLIVAVGFNSATLCGFNVNHIDLSRNHSGTLMGITNCISNFFSILAPLSVDVIGLPETDPILWKTVFFVTAGVYGATALFYIVAGRGKVQIWDNKELHKAKLATITEVYKQSEEK